MNELITYLKKCEKQVGMGIKKLRKTFTPELLHLLRVEIKKIRFIADVIAFKYPESVINEIIKPFNRIFKAAGKIRDSHIEAYLLENYSMPEIAGGLKEILLDKQKRDKSLSFFISGKDKRNMDRSFRMLALYLKTMSRMDAEAYLKAMNEMVEQYVLKDTLSPFEMHEMRKVLKKIDCAEILLEINFSSTRIINASLYDLLGKWHDHIIIIDRLKHSMEAGFEGQEEVRFYEEIISDISVRNEKYLHEIYAKIDQLRMLNGLNNSNKTENTHLN